MVDQKDADILSNKEIPESVRVKIADHLYTAGDRIADRELERQRINSDRQKLVWNTPIVAALAGLITLSATFLFERLTSRDETTNTITLEQVRNELAASEARLKQQLETAKSENLAKLEAEAKEREFQYEIVRSELTDREKSNAERAAVLLFLVRAGVLSSLNQDELRLMAEQQIESPNATIVPQLTSSRGGVRGIVGVDDVKWISEFEQGHPVVTLSKSVGRISLWDDDRKSELCTAFLIDRDRIATATFCIEKRDIDLIRFELPLGGDFSNPEREVFSVTEFEHRNNVSDDWQDGYTVLKLERPVADEIRPLTLSISEYDEGAPLAVLYFRRGDEMGAVWGASDCRVVAWGEDNIFHGCDTGGGAAGGPVIDPDTQSVVAVHLGRHIRGAVAARINRTD